MNGCTVTAREICTDPGKWKGWKVNGKTILTAGQDYNAQGMFYVIDFTDHSSWSCPVDSGAMVHAYPPEPTPVPEFSYESFNAKPDFEVPEFTDVRMPTRTALKLYAAAAASGIGFDEWIDSNVTEWTTSDE